MAVSVAPSTEAMIAIRDRINTGTAYRLDLKATYTEQLIEPLEGVEELRVDVVTEEEEQLNETLAIEDATSVVLRVWVRKKIDSIDYSDQEVSKLKLLTKQVFQRVNTYRDAAERVQVWESDYNGKQVPDKTILQTANLFVASVLFRVEVRPS